MQVKTRQSSPHRTLGVGIKRPKALRPSAQENRGYVQEHFGFASLETKKKRRTFLFFLTSHKGNRKDKDPLEKNCKSIQELSNAEGRVHSDLACFTAAAGTFHANWS